MSTKLMYKDTEVLTFDINEGIFDINNENLLPYQLKGRFKELPELSMSPSKYEITQYAIAMNKNTEAITSYFASRVLPLTRENAKKIYSLFGLEQAQDDHSKALIAITCRSVSLFDNYWVKDENDPAKYQDVDLRKNSLSETVRLVSLHGSSLTLHGNEHTPELNGQGAYAKAWKRDPEGLFLYKLGTKEKDDIEAKIEVMVSRILDKSNVRHVHYYAAESEGRFASKCKCMCDGTNSILSGMDYRSYCNVNGLNADKNIMAIDPDSMYKMWITDYLTSNRDRHGMNWGFYYNSDTMQITGCHPLFDHNNAFDSELMKDKNAPYLYDQKMTMKEAAQYAIKRTDLHFFEPVQKSDFLNTDFYDSFRERTSDLSISIQKELYNLPPETRNLFKAEKAAVREEIEKELTPQPIKGNNSIGKMQKTVKDAANSLSTNKNRITQQASASAKDVCR